MVEILKALADETRARILSLLLDGEMCVCEIEAGLKLTQSNASRHLVCLKKAGILDCYKKAQWSYYKINQKFIENNTELWEYLKVQLKRLPTYDEDYKEYQSFKNSDLCKSKKY